MLLRSTNSAGRTEFSRATYYNLKARSEAPDEMRVLGKVLITEAAAAKWRKQMKIQNAKEPPKPRRAGRPAASSTKQSAGCAPVP